jgi:glycosyltransferase AglD
MFLSVILPVYNEANRLEASYGRLKEYLARNFGSFEVIIVEDGSTDGSYDVARRISAVDSGVVLIHSEARLGRGASVALAIKRAGGDYILYMDADLATDLAYTRALVDRLAGGASVATGSRLMKGSRAERPLSRRIASMAFNSMVRLLFGSRMRDHQCGFKGFRKKDVLGLVDLVLDDHWLWDTELLILCQALGLSVDEFPVAWIHNGGNSLSASKVKLLRDSAMMGMGLLKLKCRLALYDIVPAGTGISPGNMLVKTDAR